MLVRTANPEIKPVYSLKAQDIAQQQKNVLVSILQDISTRLTQDLNKKKLLICILFIL